MAMKRALLLVPFVVLFLAAAPWDWTTQTSCTSEVQTCSSGSCSRAVPDGGSDAGISLSGVQGFTVRVCGTSARPLAGAGTLKDYHCTTGACSEVTANARAVTLTGTAATLCQELPPFVLPARLPDGDKMVWAASSVTISNWDGGAADTVTVTVCPAL